MKGLIGRALEKYRTTFDEHQTFELMLSRSRRPILTAGVTGVGGRVVEVKRKGRMIIILVVEVRVIVTLTLPMISLFLETPVRLRSTETPRFHP